MIDQEYNGNEILLVGIYCGCDELAVRTKVGLAKTWYLHRWSRRLFVCSEVL